MLNIGNFESGFNDLFGLQEKIIINGNSLTGLLQRGGIPVSYEHNSWLVS